jgi:hypothetical protein
VADVGTSEEGVAEVGAADVDVAEVFAAEVVAVGSGPVGVGSWDADSAEAGAELATDGLDSGDLDDLRFLALDELRLGVASGVTSGTAGGLVSGLVSGMTEGLLSGMTKRGRSGRTKGIGEPASSARAGGVVKAPIPALMRSNSSKTRQAPATAHTLLCQLRADRRRRNGVCLMKQRISLFICPI